MLDREKVISAIECCVVNHVRCFDDNDKLCPYFSAKVYMCEIELLADALALLKEHETKTGKWIEQDGYDGDVYYNCSVCGGSWVTIEGTPQENGMLYCPHCGAKMEGR